MGFYWNVLLESGGEGVGPVAAFGQKLGSDWPEQTVHTRWADSLELSLDLGGCFLELGMTEQSLVVEADEVSEMHGGWVASKLPAKEQIRQYVWAVVFLAAAALKE